MPAQRSTVDTDGVRPPSTLSSGLSSYCSTSIIRSWLSIDVDAVVVDAVDVDDDDDVVVVVVDAGGGGVGDVDDIFIAMSEEDSESGMDELGETEREDEGDVTADPGTDPVPVPVPVPDPVPVPVPVLVGGGVFLPVENL